MESFVLKYLRAKQAANFARLRYIRYEYQKGGSTPYLLGKRIREAIQRLPRDFASVCIRVVIPGRRQNKKVDSGEK